MYGMVCFHSICWTHIWLWRCSFSLVVVQPLCLFFSSLFFLFLRTIWLFVVIFYVQSPVWVFSHLTIVCVIFFSLSTLSSRLYYFFLLLFFGSTSFCHQHPLPSPSLPPSPLVIHSIPPFLIIRIHPLSFPRSNHLLHIHLLHHCVPFLPPKQISHPSNQTKHQ